MDGTWQANWNTPKGYANSFRVLSVTPNATEYVFTPSAQTARFNFR